jgi:hypothetical protein
VSDWLDDLMKGGEFDRFVDSVEGFCATLERVESLPRATFLQDLDRQLPQVYSAAAVLPDYPWDEEDDDNDTLGEGPGRLAKELDMYQRVRAKLGHLDVYSFVFDPVDHTNRDVIGGSLAEDLASVYADLKQPMELYRSGSEAEIKHALWDWGLGRKMHWGRHGVHAMGVIYSLVHQHYDEDEGTFDVKSDMDPLP